jgi:hypothetical protein
MTTGTRRLRYSLAIWYARRAVYVSTLIATRSAGSSNGMRSIRSS